VCERLDIPYIRIDMMAEFESAVIEDFVKTYARGETPNPCIRCNQCVRFSSFYTALQQNLRERELLSNGGELYFATGHYVRIRETDGRYYLGKAVDESKDQSYMLYKIDPSMLPLLRFPLGEMYKRKVVEYAKKRGLPSASVRESQDVCFTSGSYFDFICTYSPDKVPDHPGEIVDTAGKLLGSHRGYIKYTVGQRKGLGLGNGPWYVVRLVPEMNQVVVGRAEELNTNRFYVDETNWFIPPPVKSFSCSVKLRYNSPEVGCRILPQDESKATVELLEPAAVTPGQSAVFYNEELVLGGGIIHSF
jgi:tRNA-specific 2-thiouridylase